MDNSSTWPTGVDATNGVVVAGVSWCNLNAVAGLLSKVDKDPRLEIDIPSGLDIAQREGRLLLAWAAKLTRDLEQEAAMRGVQVVRIEDGFLRSVGLGAALVQGASYALDARGMHYDATRPNDLEHMLEHDDVSDDEARRGARIAEFIVTRNLSKYNLASEPTRLPATPGRERILVPGQVADDMAIRLTVSDTLDLKADNVNLELLRAARARHPDAFIIYKPHPDVVRGLRRGQIDPQVVRQFADIEVPYADILGLIEQCDRVETLSSLTGFEALIRGKAVTVHGSPFYAGWGLTEDLTAFPRRTRRRTVEELVYLSLARYCRYVDPQTLAPIACEQLIERIAELKTKQKSQMLEPVRLMVLRLASRLGFYRKVNSLVIRSGRLVRSASATLWTAASRPSRE